MLFPAPGSRTPHAGSIASLRSRRSRLSIPATLATCLCLMLAGCNGSDVSPSTTPPPSGGAAGGGAAGGGATSGGATGGGATGGGSTTSCPQTQPRQGTTTASIDGQVYSADLAVIPQYVSVIQMFTLVTSDCAQPQKGIGLVITGITGPGTFTAATANGNVEFVGPATGPARWNTKDGQPVGSIVVTVTRFDRSGATGTFSFAANGVPGREAPGTRQVTNGRFDVTFGANDYR